MIRPEQNVYPYHFVVSSPRSGSTWLARALNQHPEILATENRLFGMFCELWQNNNGKLAPRITADRYLRSFSKHSFFESLGYSSAAELEGELKSEFISFLCNFLLRQSGKKVIVDKVTPYLGTSTEILKSAKQHFDDAKFIHLVRDGRDVAVSGVFDWVAREDKNSERYKLLVEKATNVRMTRFFDDELIQRWASYWLEPIQAMAQSPFDPGQVLEIRYEKMLQHQASELIRLFGFLDVGGDIELARNCADAVTFEKTTGRAAGETDDLAKARKGVSGDWKNYFTRQDAAFFQTLTGDLLQRLGYESDPTWVERCPEELDMQAPN